MIARLIPIALLLGAAAAQAQSPAEKYSGRQIAAVRVFVERAPTADSAIVELVATTPGEVLTLGAVRETISHLYSLGRYQNVEVEAVEAPGGAIELHYNLVPIRALERVEFRGSLGLSRRLLRTTIEERFGETPQAGRAAEVLRVLERVYEDHGYFRTVIRPGTTEPVGSRGSVLAFEISAGPRAQIATIDISGELPEPRAELLRQLKVAPGQPYERIALDARLTEYSRRLRDRGHLQALATHRATLSEDGAAASLTFDIEAGPLMEVAFEGDPIPRDKHDELVPYKAEGSLHEDLIEDSSLRIAEYLRAQGYWKADVQIDRRETPEKQTIVFKVQRGPLYRLASEGVQVTGNKAIGLAEIRPLILLAPGQPYVAAPIYAARGALDLLYRQRGFAWVKVDVVETDVSEGTSADATVRPRLVVVEGPQSRIGQIQITNVKALSEGEILQLVKAKPGDPFYEPSLRADRDAIETAYRDLGYATVSVGVKPQISEDRARVDLTYAVNEGPQTIVDHVIIVGNQRTSEDVIRREVLFKPGTPLGVRDVLETRRRLSRLGLFRRIDIRELEHGSPTRRDVLVTVEESQAMTLGYGGGLELTNRLRTGQDEQPEDRLELSPRGFFEIGRRNLWGKNRAVNLFTRVSIRPNDAPGDPERDGRGLGFSEYRVIGTYREPRAFDLNADVALTGAVEQGVRSSFNFVRKGVTGEMLRTLSPSLRISTRYSFNTTRIFDERLDDEEQALIDRRFPQVRLSVVSAAVILDRRDDLVDPSRGGFVSLETSMASRATGGQVGFLKSYVEGHWFYRLPGRRRIIFATRLSLGLADGFPREVQPTDAQGRPIEGEPVIIEDLPASERFFAGGDTSIRGFKLDRVGTEKTLSQAGYPRGGNAVLIANTELRVHVWKDFGAAFFTDGGNVFERVSDFDFSELRGSYGFGIRYGSPIGPVRLDLGFNPSRRLLGTELEKPMVLHFSIGQAF